MRDRRLDFWRGLCLIDMVLVHLVHEGVQFGMLGPLIVDYTRFAAGGFVFVAGLGVGLMFLVGIAERPTAPATDATSILHRRALYLLGVHYALTGLVVALDALRGLRPLVAEPLAMLRDIVLLQIAPSYIDVLPLYVAMLLIAPLLLTLLRRGLWPIVACASAIVFAYGRHYPAALSPRASIEFPFLLWQAFFVAGLVFSLAVPHLDRRQRGWRLGMVGAWIGFATVTVLAYGPRFHLLPEATFLSFAKVPLTLGELVRYLAAIFVVVTTSAVGWHRLHRSKAVAAIATLGRRSLAIYGAHVFVQMAVVAAATPFWSLGTAQGLVAIPMLAILWGIGRGLDSRETRARTWHKARRVLRSWGAPPAGIVTAACLLAFVRLATVSSFGVDQEVLDSPRPDLLIDVDQQGSAIDLIDALEEPTLVAPDATDASEPSDGQSTIDTLEEAPVQSGMEAPSYA